MRTLLSTALAASTFMFSFSGATFGGETADVSPFSASAPAPSGAITNAAGTAAPTSGDTVPTGRIFDWD